MDVFIYSSLPLKDARQALEDDIDELLMDLGEVTGGGAGTSGWNIDIELYEDPNTEKTLSRLKRFLQEWPVPEDTLIEYNGEQEQVYQVDGI
jgi:hypothetical protein